MNPKRAAPLWGYLIVGLSACAFKEAAVDVYHCTEEQPGCPVGLICSGGLCVPDGTRDAGSQDGPDAANGVAPPCTAGIANRQRDCASDADGICTPGSQTCVFQGGEWSWTKCEPKIQPGATVEACTGGLDEDCDGSTDAADSDCFNCGDGVKNPLEECDGEDFGPKTCRNSGFDQGALVCSSPTDSAPCTINYSGCIACTAPTPPDGVEPDRIVDAANGSDSQAVGTCIAYRRINAALSGLSAGAVVWVAPGTYSAATTGDTFPIGVLAGVSLIGDEASQGSGTLIRGDGVVYSYWRGVVRLYANSSIAGFQLVNDTATGNVTGIFSEGRPARIANNRLNAKTAGIHLRGAGGTRPTDIVGNRFYAATYGLYLWGVSDDNSPQPKVRNNHFDEQTSAAIYSSNRAANPDLGLDVVTDPGGNTFAGGAGTRVIYHKASTEVYAYGNTWPNDPPRCAYEIEVDLGKVTWGTGTGEFCAP